MLRLYASNWNEIIRQLETLNNALNLSLIDALVHGPKDAVLIPLNKIMELCASLGMTSSEVYAARLMSEIEQTPTLGEQQATVLDHIAESLEAINKRQPAPKKPPEFQKIDVAQRAAILRERIDDDFRVVELYIIDPQHTKYITDPDPFAVVDTGLHSAAFDIEEAGKCFAFEHYTACVFHLMRAMESGLRSLGASLNDPVDPKTNPTWERILGRCDAELKKPFLDQSPTWQSNPQFFAEATANLRAVKTAWRNPVMHVEQKYTPAHAEEIWNSVRTFVRHLATPRAAS